MEIIGNKIQLAVTEEEANILLQAVGRYVFHGPYWPPESYQCLTEAEQKRAENMKKSAHDMCESLQEELLRRYHESEEIKFYQGI